MVSGISNYQNYSYLMYSGSVSGVSGVQRPGSYSSVAQTQAQSWLETFKSNNDKVETFTAESADFLKNYTTGMNELNSSASRLTNGGIADYLYDEQGAVTSETVANTVGAVQDMVDDYNSTLRLLNDNAERGTGVMDQMARMVDDPAPQASMELVGMSVNDDGTLALDAQALTSALSTENSAQLSLYEDILGGAYGVAAGVQDDARAGMNASASSLINQDIAQMQSIRNDDPIRSYAQSLRGGGAYALNNNAAVGIMMNMMA